MSSFVQTFEAALVAAAVYLLLGLGWNVVYRACGYLNLAIGEVFILAGVLAAKLPERLGTDQPLIVGAAVVAVVAAGAWLAERATLRPLRARGEAAMLTTLGLGLLVGELAHRLAPEVALRTPPMVAGPPLRIAGAAVPRQDLVIVAVALAAWATLAFLVTRTAAGRTVRACADDRASARWLGIDLPRVETSAFVVSAVLAAVAAVVATPAIGVSAGSGTILAVTSFLAVSLGGIGSDRGAIFGALAVALAEAFTARYWSSDVKELVVMVLLVVVLIARPAMTGTRIRPHRRDSVR
ncbi:MAG: branched-chain amino acid ABC transporter permease [Acidimicrobiales bacterium]|nr:branched-chain amino acid ABC transporter permease [Acidimicrobiales bacterium]